MKQLRVLTLHVLRAIGGFSLALFLTRTRLRVLCYHGFSVHDEFALMPMMFMRADTFERRLRILHRRRIPVIPLGEGVRRLQEGAVKNAETVITLDDGWASNLTIGLPLLERYSYPASVYVTTEHLSGTAEAFNVALSYMVQKSSKQMLTLSGIHRDVDGDYPIHDDASRQVARLIAAAEGAFSLSERQRILPAISRALAVDYLDVFKDARFTFLNRDQMRELHNRGIDMQLHTHTHRLPHDNADAMNDEILLNRTALKAITGTEARHFCYPSGDYLNSDADALLRLNIISATTCDPGLNDRTDSPFRLKRFLDSDATSDITFEAEICGIKELARLAKARAGRIFGAAAHGAA